MYLYKTDKWKGGNGDEVNPTAQSKAAQASDSGSKGKKGKVLDRSHGQGEGKEKSTDVKKERKLSF